MMNLKVVLDTKESIAHRAEQKIGLEPVLRYGATLCRIQFVM